MEIRNHAKLPAAELQAISKDFTAIHSLQDLLHWAQRQPQEDLRPGVITDIVIQDEFTHDVVVPWKSLHIVFGTT